MANAKKVIQDYSGRITGTYISNQYEQYTSEKRHSDHKRTIHDNDQAYSGDLRQLYPDEALPAHPLVENKFKNSLHDLARLASEAKPTPIFMQRGIKKEQFTQARVREQIVATLWEMGRGPALERQLYMDLAGTGYMAVTAYYNSRSEFAQFMRLDPRYCYPNVQNGHIVDMLYIETMNAVVAMAKFPDINFDVDRIDEEVRIITYIDEEEVCQAVMQVKNGETSRPVSTEIVERWVHGLGCVPVAFVQIETFDSAFRGLFDQLHGPTALRNRIVSYLDDYLEDMVHAPYEERGILNNDEPPGPLRVYHHDPNRDDTFMRRVPPAAPAGAVFGLIQYMDDQESKEAIQPPSRVGSVSQSIASGSFVASTQGSLSSTVKELQDLMGEFRYQLHYILMKIEEHYLNFEKPLIRSVGKKVTYTPSKDIGGEYTHRLIFGAGAGLDRQYADVRVLQHQGAGLISKQTARAQIDYLDDASSEQEIIDREQLASVVFQRFAADPAQPLSAALEALAKMTKGETMADVVDALTQRVLEEEQRALEAQGQGGLVPPEEGVEPGAEQAALEAGGMPTEAPLFDIATPLPPMQQQIVANR